MHAGLELLADVTGVRASVVDTGLSAEHVSSSKHFTSLSSLL